MQVLKVNDNIVYGSQGICKVEDIIERDFTGSMNKYYVLKPIQDKNSTIYVPVNNTSLISRMRRLLSEEEIYQMIKEISGEKTDWTEDKNERKEKYKKIFEQGDCVEIMKMIKNIYVHQQEQEKQGRKLHLIDEQFFKKAEKILYHEFAFVLKMEPEKVLPFILEQVQTDN